MKKFAALLICVSFNSLLLFAQDDWNLSKESEGIKVYTKKLSNSKFKSVKVECIIEGTIDKLVAILNNVDGNTKWVYKTKRTNSVRRVSNNEFIYYAETILPWPLSNRDVVINMLFSRDEAAKTLTVKATGLPGEVEKKDGIVRLAYFDGLWTVNQIDANHITILYLLTVDPGGSVPAWAYNMFVAKGPYNTFSNLAALLKK